MTDLSTLTASLSEAQKQFIRAASKRPKKWGVIYRHAKVSKNVRFHEMFRFKLMDHGPNWREGYFLTSLGLALRDHLERNG